MPRKIPENIRWTAKVIYNLGNLSLNYIQKAFGITPKRYTIFMMISSESTTCWYTRLMVAHPIKMEKHSELDDKLFSELRIWNKWIFTKCRINFNETGLFDSSFFWRGKGGEICNLTLLSCFKKSYSNINIIYKTVKKPVQN